MPPQSSAASRGFAFAMTAYLIWGLIVPIYMKTMSQVPPLEILAQRIVWSIPFTALILWWLGKFDAVLPVLRSARTLGLLMLTASIISVNWGVYVYAIVSNHALDAALGYYINPLVNVVLGALVLGERPTRLQGVAIGLAAAAVCVLTWQAGGLPWIALVLASTFGTYGLLRKVLPVGPTEGFFVEVLILSVPCLALIGWTVATGTSRFVVDAGDAILLVGAGPLTAIPLILFAAGAKLLDYSTIGILQYVAPTALFFTAVFAFHEPFSGWQLVAFALIWAAVAIYVWSLFASRRAQREADRKEQAVVPPCV